jgi:hypothetical protein
MAKKRKVPAKRAPRGALHYVEFIDSYLGSQLGYGWITRADLRKIAEVAKAERDGKLQDSDPCEEDLWEQLMHTDDTLYMTNEVFGYDVKNPIRRCAAILKAVESVNGNFGALVEEGSFAFGLSKKMAMDKLRKLEMHSRVDDCW